MNKLFSFVIFFILLQGIAMGAIVDTIKLKDTKIPLIFEKNDNLPIFNLQLVFQNSGYINDKKKQGLTSLSAKLLNEGTKQDGVIKFSRKLESKAISIHTSHGFETFVIELSCLKSEYKEALQYLNDLLTNPNLTQKTLDKLKVLQISKLEQKENDFDYIAKIGLKSMIFKDTPLDNVSMGTKESLESITLKDIEENLKNIFNINNLIVVSGGQFDKSLIKKEILPIIKNFDKKQKTHFAQINPNSNGKTKIIKKDTEQAYIYFGSDLNIKANAKDVYKAKVASFILGGSGFGSRLMEGIRVKHGLAYSAYGYFSINKSHTYFMGYLQTKIENQAKAKKLVLKTIEDFVKNGVTKEELVAAKKFLNGSEPLRVETFSQRLNRAYHLFYKGLEQDYPKKELELIESLSLKDLNSFIKEHDEILNVSFSIVTK
jgi:predicted Zn-dependent peptidase